MSLCYLLDGYNIIKQTSRLALKGLKNGREGLVSLIDIYRPQGSRQNKVIIVFDGQPGMINEESSPTVKVVFSENESADDKIRSLVAASNRKREIVVVTDDKELKFSVRALGANVLGVKDFLQKIKKRDIITTAGQTKKPKHEEEEKHISKTLEYKITAELEKIWLGK